MPGHAKSNIPKLGSRNTPQNDSPRKKYSMQPKRSLIYILAALITLPLFGSVAPATTIDIIQTFDFPGPNVTATLPQKIEDQTDLIGTLISSDGTVRAFIYKPLGLRSAPLLLPSFATKGTLLKAGALTLSGTSCRRVSEPKRWHLSRLFDDPPQLYQPHATTTPSPTPTATPRKL